MNGLINGEIVVKDIFHFEQQGVTEEGDVIGEFVTNREVPYVYDKIVRRGIHIIDQIFSKK